MSEKYKNYPIKIDGSSILEEAWSYIFPTTNDALNYEAAVRAVLDTIDGKPTGKQVLTGLPKDQWLVIVPYDGNGGACNAWADEATIVERGQARVCYSPSTWKVGGMCTPTASAGPGSGADEILLHELLHAFRKLRKTYNRVKLSLPDKAYDDIEELWSILVTNIYSSESGKLKFRKDHSAFGELPAKWATSEGFMRDPDFFKWIEYFCLTEPGLTNQIANSAAAFNPIKAYKALRDAQEAAMAASW